VATQDRAIRTRHNILTAAAKVFEERGYQAATISEILATAGVTKGALYFHFQSKEELAQGVLAEQDQQLAVPERACRMQKFVDVVMLQAYRLETDAMVRAGVRLSMDQRADGLDRSAPFLNWTTIMCELLEQAQARGELLPHVIPADTAAVVVGSFGGIQAMSHATTNYQDLPQRSIDLMRHLLPSIVIPSALATIDLTPGRGQAIHDELTGTPAPPAAADSATPAGTLS
jgi:AcrR family transcriptional regulator